MGWLETALCVVLTFMGLSMAVMIFASLVLLFATFIRALWHELTGDKWKEW